jgi:peptide-methionine (S)-S-oxide reductase
MFGLGRTAYMVEEEEALPGRAELSFEIPKRHDVLNTELLAEPHGDQQVAYFALGCFWGAERLFWQLPGVVSTAVGYMGGFTAYPTYEEVCTGLTGHSEVVRVVFDPHIITYQELLQIFWQEHDPTQGMRQGNDVGSQYRSVIFTTSPEQSATAQLSLASYQQALTQAGRGVITTEVVATPGPDATPDFVKGVPLTFYPAEAYHQQYLHKVPNGYCGLQGTGVACP